MTTIEIDLNRALAPSGGAVIGSTVMAETAWAELQYITDGTKRVLVKTASTWSLPGGTGTIEAEPTPENNALRIKFHSGLPEPLEVFVLVPESGTHHLVDLERVDPRDLSPVGPTTPLWTSQLSSEAQARAAGDAALAQQIDAIETGPGIDDINVVGDEIVFDLNNGTTKSAPLPSTLIDSAEFMTEQIATPGTGPNLALSANYVRGGTDGVVWDVLTGPGAAVGDGTTDDTAAVQARIDAAAPFGVTVLLGKHAVTTALTVPNGSRIAGRNGDAQIVLPAAAAFPAFDIDGTSNVDLSAVRVTRAGATAIGAAAVTVRGSSTAVRITDVTAESLYEGFRVEGGVGTTPGICQQVTLTRCRSENADQYGYRIDETDGVELAHCVSDGSGLDGIKLRRKTKNFVCTGGYYTGAIGGDGIDAYAGGGDFTIQGTVFSGNTLNGIVIKNDDLNLSDPAGYGLVRNATLTGIIACNNGGAGLTIHRNGSTDDPAEPLVQRISVHGGIYNNNVNYGVFVNARQVSIMGAMAARNGLDGIRVDAGSLDVDLVACHSAGNSVTVVGGRDGIHIAGKRVKVWGGSSIGADPDGAANDTAVSAGTKTQRYGLRIANTASGCMVSGLTLRDNVTGAYSDLAIDTVFFNNPSDGGSVPFLIMPNNQRLFGRKADGALASVAYITTGGGLNIGDAAATTSILGATLNLFPKVLALGEVEIDGPLNHDGITVGFYGKAPVTQPDANPDTTGATLAALETEVNELKALLRSLGLMAT